MNEKEVNPQECPILDHASRPSFPLIYSNRRSRFGKMVILSTVLRYDVNLSARFWFMTFETRLRYPRLFARLTVPTMYAEATYSRTWAASRTRPVCEHQPSEWLSTGFSPYTAARYHGKLPLFTSIDVGP